MILETQLSAHDICIGNLLFMRVSQILDLDIHLICA